MDAEQREREARGMLSARLEHDWECQTQTLMEGPCDCNPAQYLDAYKAAILARVREQVEGMRVDPPSCLSSDYSEMVCRCIR